LVAGLRGGVDLNHLPPVSSPLWKHDRNYPRKGAGLIGVDEAGRGCLAGPVYAAAVFLPEPFFSHQWRSLRAPKIDDSKKLTAKERETALEFLHRIRETDGVLFAFGSADVQEIKIHNILGATTLAMSRALEALGIDLQPSGLSLWTQKPDGTFYPPVLIDGRPVRRLPYEHNALVKGDSLSLTIALASVVAKVERDRWMAKAHDQYSAYGWARNRGYGTEEHRRALLENGPSPLHRELFLRKILGKSSG